MLFVDWIIDFNIQALATAAGLLDLLLTDFSQFSVSFITVHFGPTRWRQQVNTVRIQRFWALNYGPKEKEESSPVQTLSECEVGEEESCLFYHYVYLHRENIRTIWNIFSISLQLLHRQVKLLLHFSHILTTLACNCFKFHVLMSHAQVQWNVFLENSKSNNVIINKNIIPEKTHEK